MGSIRVDDASSATAMKGEPYLSDEVGDEVCEIYRNISPRVDADAFEELQPMSVFYLDHYEILSAT
jgi:hypothetical protein